MFPPIDEARWRELVRRALGGRGFETLISTTPEGLPIEPLYPRSIADAPRALRQRPGAWRISQRVDHPEAATANAMARADLENGADALALAIAQAPAARGFGVAIASESDLDDALAGVELDLISLRLDAGARALEIAQFFLALARKRRLTSAALDIDFGHDPIGHFARSGVPAAAFAEIGREAAEASKVLRDAGFAGRLMLADGRPYHEAGAGEAQELAAALATGVAYLRLLESAGLSLEGARDEIAFLLAADSDEFVTLAKFRALRRLWACVETACGLAPKPIRLHAETAFRMMTKHDPWTNILRATMAVFSAGLGGADAITVLPFTLALGLPDDFARRIARNTQLLLVHEASLAKVIDPAAGAGSFEKLTEELCARAWALFQRIEKSGGMIRSLEVGLPQEEIAATASARRQAIAHRAQAIIGTSAFPDLAEAPVRVLAPAPDVEKPAPTVLQCTPLPSQRDAEPYEILRAASEAERARTGARPRVFLANLGTAEGFSQRSNFARNLFAAAGLEALSCAGFETAQEAAEAFRDARCRIACICAAEAVQAEMVAETAWALAAAAAGRIYLAAQPDEAETALRDAGIADFIYPGCDALAILERALASAVCDN
ncbi:methylmalonyl-CoA mutase family protein [Methylocapsa polymorpha]|uniref:methylmalonyl-CoA mutase family protein n=1 Tax=Methylocapsa polymorpha TaxID=3080828 RepID=UPI00388EBB66